MLSDERIRVLRSKARARARARPDAALAAAAEKADRVAKQARSRDAQVAFTVLVEVYRAELDRRHPAR